MKYFLSVFFALISFIAASVSAQTLGDLVSQAAPSQFSRNLYIGLSGPDVSALQQKLKDLGYYAYPEITGWYGPVTAQAVSKFQQAYADEILIPNGISAPTGTFGPATRAKLASLSNSPASNLPASGGGTAASDPGCPPGFNYSFLTGKPCARASAIAPAQVSKSTPSSSVSGRPSRSGGGSSRSTGGSGSSGSSSGGTQAPAKPGTIIPAGSGFSGPTPQPPAIGTGTGSDAKAIARWDVVPYQTFDGNFNVGVVAFHMSGIDRVEFSANGGEWVSVSKMTKNPQTAGNGWDGVAEYWATLRASDFPDGPVEVRAVAYPEKGVPRVLAGAAIQANGENSLMLSANYNHTLPSLVRYVATTGSDIAGDGSPEKPFATIMKAARAIQDASGTGTADGGTIYLSSGNHIYGTYNFGLYTTTSKRWLTIMPAPGVSKESVKLVEGKPDGLRTKLVHIKGITISPRVGANQSIFLTNAPEQDYLWIDDSDLIGPGRTVNGMWTNGWSGFFVTNSTISASRDGISGLLIRDVTVSNIGSDAFSDSGMVVNSTAHTVDESGTTFHADVLQYYGSHENLIAYGVTAEDHIYAQGVFTGYNIPLSNVALVNVAFNNQVNIPGSNVAAVFGFGGKTEHLYVKDSSFIGPAHWRVDQAFSARNVVLERVTGSNGAPLRPQPGALSGVTYIDSASTSNASNQNNSGTQQQTETPTSPSSSTPDLIAHWTMDSGDINWTSGAVTDASGSGHTAGLGNMSAASNSVTGKIGQAVRFAGAHNVVANGVTAADAMESFTHSMWIKLDACPYGCDGQVILDKEQKVYLMTDSCGYACSGIKAYVAHGTTNAVKTTNDIRATVSGKWTHVAMTYDGATKAVRVYINGEESGDVGYATNTAGSGARSNDASLIAGRLMYGQNIYGNKRMSGSIDDVRIYNRALSASEVQSLYNQ